MMGRRAKFGLYELGKQQAKRSRAAEKLLFCGRIPDRAVVFQLVKQCYGSGLIHREPMVLFRKFNDFSTTYALSESSFLAQYRFVTKKVMTTVNRSEKVYGMQSEAMKKELARLAAKK